MYETYVYGIDEDVFENATIADSVHFGGYPIHLHSHGYQGWGATSAFLMRYFVSHGRFDSLFYHMSHKLLA